MSEVSQSDIDRMHARLDDMHAEQTAQAILLARIDERFAGLSAAVSRIPAPAPARPRPCEFFQKHMEEHAKVQEAAVRDWRRVALQLAAPAIAGAGGGGAIVAVLLKVFGG